MPTLTFTQDNMPTREEMHRLIEEMRQRSNPIDDLVELTQEITLFEQRYKMTSSEFFDKYQRGEMGDDLDFIEWAGQYRMYLDLKHKIELSLERVMS
jgi:hypothetical protein